MEHSSVFWATENKQVGSVAEVHVMNQRTANFSNFKGKSLNR